MQKRNKNTLLKKITLKGITATKYTEHWYKKIMELAFQLIRKMLKKQYH